MKFGFYLPTYGGWLRGQPKTDETSFEYAKKAALLAEEYGLDSVWVPDHMLNPMVSEKEYCPDSWVWLSAVATLTSKIRLGHIVICYAFRNPSLTAKMTTTLDEVSKGRFILGVGACNYRREFEAYGFPWLEKKEERVEALTEFLTVVKGILKSPDGFSFKGKYYSVVNCILKPKPTQKPHPPIWVGGENQWIQKLAAEMGNCWLFYGDSPEKVEEKIRKFEETYKKPVEYAMNSRFEVGESKAKVEEKFKKLVPTLTRPQLDRILDSAVVGSVDECIKKIEKFTDTKLNYLILQSNNTLKDLERFGKEILPSFK